MSFTVIWLPGIVSGVAIDTGCQQKQSAEVIGKSTYLEGGRLFNKRLYP